uniref:SH3_10 domain-containing protein n=1 Tax=Macrostomum lignano TaxID=282301 RepID=A0A1I8G870_9PLAT
MASLETPDNPDVIEAAQAWLTANADVIASPRLGCSQQALLHQSRTQESLLAKIASLEEQLAIASSSEAQKLQQARGQVSINKDAIAYLRQKPPSRPPQAIACRSLRVLAEPRRAAGDRARPEQLSNEVSQTWEWVTRLGELTQLHLKNSADYQWFYHEANELEEVINSRNLANAQVVGSIPPTGQLSSMQRMNTVLSDNYSQLLLLSQRTDQLMSKSHSVVPLYRRCQPVDVGYPARNIFRFDDGENTLNNSEEVTVLDNSNSFNWKVAKADGTVMEVPSICIWLPPPDTEAVEVAVVIRRKLRNTWASLLTEVQQWLTQFYSDYLQKLLSNDTVTAEPSAQLTFLNFLTQLEEALSDGLLGDEGQQRSQLVEAVQAVRDRLVLSSPDQSSTVRSSDAVLLRSLLEKLLEHMRNWKCLNEQLEFFKRDHSGLTEESAQMMTAISVLQKMQEESGKQMEDLQTRMQDWSLYSTRLTEVRKSTTVNQSVQQRESQSLAVQVTGSSQTDGQSVTNSQRMDTTDLLFEGRRGSLRDSRESEWYPLLESRPVDLTSIRDLTVAKDQVRQQLRRASMSESTQTKPPPRSPVGLLSPTSKSVQAGYSEYRQNSTQDIEDPVFRQAVYNYIQEYESEVKRYLHENIPSPIVHSQSAYAAASASEGRSQLRVGVEEKLEYSETRKLATAISSSNESEANATSSSGSGTGAAVGKTQAVTREAGCQTAQIPIASTGCDKQSVMAESKIACHLHYTVQNDLFCLEIESSDSETQTDQSGQTVETEEKLIKYESRVDERVERQSVDIEIKIEEETNRKKLMATQPPRKVEVQDACVKTTCETEESVLVVKQQIKYMQLSQELVTAEQGVNCVIENQISDFECSFDLEFADSSVNCKTEEKTQEISTCEVHYENHFSEAALQTDSFTGESSISMTTKDVSVTAKQVVSELGFAEEVEKIKAVNSNVKFSNMPKILECNSSLEFMHENAGVRAQPTVDEMGVSQPTVDEMGVSETLLTSDGSVRYKEEPKLNECFTFSETSFLEGAIRVETLVKEASVQVEQPVDGMGACEMLLTSVGSVRYKEEL